MIFQKIHPVEDAEQIAEYYQTIYTALGGNTDDEQLWLIKKEGWTVVAAYDGYFYEEEDETRLIQVLWNFGYTEFIAVAWSKGYFYPRAYVIPTSFAGVEEFRLNHYGWYVFFAGQPDWFILIANTLNFILIGGKPEFVQQVLGCELEEAAVEIRKMSESDYLHPVVCRYYAYLLYQTQVVYPQAEPGTRISLGLLID
jgi:hypothetical protein